jgi:hypothetical protein
MRLQCTETLSDLLDHVRIGMASAGAARALSSPGPPGAATAGWCGVTVTEPAMRARACCRTVVSQPEAAASVRVRVTGTSQCALALSRAGAGPGGGPPAVGEPADWPARARPGD